MDIRPDNVDTKRQTTNRGMLPRFLLVAALLLPALSVTPRAEAAPRVQPQLPAMAAQHPDAVKSTTSADTISTPETVDVNPTTSDVNWSS